MFAPFFRPLARPLASPPALPLAVLPAATEAAPGSLAAFGQADLAPYQLVYDGLPILFGVPIILTPELQVEI